MIQFDNVTKRYGTRLALDEVSFSLDPAEMAFLVGHSGAGKSTLLRHLVCLEAPTEGRVMVGNFDLRKLSADQLPMFRRKVGVVFQDPQLLSDRTVFENVALPLRAAGFDRAVIPARVKAALEQVELSHLEQALPGELSSGQRQRVGIARAVVHKPALLLADEPTGNLDPELSKKIMKLFTQFRNHGVTVLIATHEQALVEAQPFRVLRLDQGRLVESGR
ncbi:MAG: cell division ATP-binding protein FtsE [Litorivicinus sp.]